jgi:16S rRNA (guanine1207-N2)-methyltransferase
MHPVSQIIERNLPPAERADRALWVNPDKDHCWRAAGRSCGGLTLFSQDFSSHAFFEQTGADSLFAAFPPATAQGYDWIIVNQPRQKALLRMLLDAVAGLLADGGTVWLAGENKAGIKSADKLLKARFGQVRKLDNARHCTLFEAGNALPHAAFEPAAYREKWLLDLQPGEIRVVSYPGVFAHGRLDEGTSLLLQALGDVDITGEVLDFACGAGVVGACIASVHPGCRLTLLDSSALALRSSAETFAANHCEAGFLASDGLSEVTAKYDFIISNPPIHAGVKTDSRLGVRLLENAHQFLNPGGMLIVVANIHLPYENLLTKHYRQQRRLCANERYKVIAASL